MQNRRPVVGAAPPNAPRIAGPVAPRAPRIDVGATPARARIAFSFRFWQQAKHFGLAPKDATWFVALLDKLHALSEYERDRFLTEGALRDQWRYHPVNHSARGAALARADLVWVDRRYLENEDEFPLYQFQVTRGLGRVIGFWDELGVFQIVLIDSMHNMEPGTFNNYKVRPADKLGCTYSSLLASLDDRLHEAGVGAPERQAILSAHRQRSDFNAILIPLSEDRSEELLQALKEGVFLSLRDLLETALIQALYSGK